MLDKLPKSGSLPLASVPTGASSPTDDVPRVDPGDRFERRDSATQARGRTKSAASMASFVSSAAGWIGRRRPVVAAVLLATMVPMVSGPGLADRDVDSTRTELVQTETRTTAAARADAILATPLFSARRYEGPYRDRISSVHSALLDAGHTPRADGVPVWVLTDDAEAGAAMVSVIADDKIGLAPGATMYFDSTSPVLDSDHRALRRRVDAALEALSKGTSLDDATIRDVSSLVVFDAAARVEAVRDARVGGRTNLAVLSGDQSAMDVARRLVAAMSNAPAGSAANAELAALGAEGERTGALADRIVETLERDSGVRAMSPAKRALRSQLELARVDGVLVFAAAGDTRTAGDDKDRSEPLAGNLEQLLTIGAARLDGTMRASSAFGTVSLAALGEGAPVGSTGTHDGTESAAAYATATAALMLTARPDATADELEHLLTDPRSRVPVPETGRDGLGRIDVVAAVTFASTDVAFPASTERYRAIQAMKSGPDIADDHPYVAHVQHIRRSLAERGLPTRGDGVKVFVIEPAWSEHNGNVLRTIADETFGLAPGADVHLVTESPWYDARERSLARSYSAAKSAIRGGGVPTAAMIVDRAEMSVLSRAADVRGISERVDGTETVFVNMSYGTTSSSIASSILDVLEDAPENSRASQYLHELGGTRTERHHEMIRRVGSALDAPAAQRRMTHARGRLAREIRAARDNRVIVYTSAGNARDEVPVENRGYSAHVSDGVPGLMVIGATDLFDPTNFGDDRMTNFSSEGRVTFATPGATMPVKRDGRDGRGTSYASPYGVAGGVLMVAANPDLTPDEIEAIQRRVAHDIPTELDGAGVFDPIAAVANAVFLGM